MKSPIIEWTISRGPANPTGLHFQARTKDQLCSFAVVTASEPNIHRGKTADGKLDIFTLYDDATKATMNVVGKINYAGEWGDA
jgi:hypothetical protein